MSKASDSASSSEAGDIPAKAKQKQVAAVEPDDEDMSEDEYVVEGIESHKFEKDGTLYLEVKWQGWEEKTWEPEENLDGCPDELKAYFEEIGGKPVFKPRDPSASASKKRKLGKNGSAKSSPAPTPKASASKATKAETKSSAGAGRGRRKQLDPAETTRTPTPRGTANSAANGTAASSQEFVPPAGSWESYISEVQTVMRNDLGRIMVMLQWTDGHLSEHPAPIVHKKAPLKLLEFYEAHLQWNNPQGADSQARGGATPAASTTTLPERQSAAAKRVSASTADLKVGLDDSDSEAEDVEGGIKGVATAVW